MKCKMAIFYDIFLYNAILDYAVKYFAMYTAAGDTKMIWTLQDTCDPEVVFKSFYKKNCCICLHTVISTACRGFDLCRLKIYIPHVALLIIYWYDINNYPKQLDEKADNVFFRICNSPYIFFSFDWFIFARVSFGVEIELKNMFAKIFSLHLQDINDS